MPALKERRYMERQVVKIKGLEQLTHDVLRIQTERPGGLTFRAGHATSVAINAQGWRNELRPFTMASAPNDPFLEFIIKVYPDHDGTTERLQAASVGDELILEGVYGSISYQGEGLFIAGGTGITPFLSIFRELHQARDLGGNTLIFVNKRKQDVFLEEELRRMLGENAIFMLSREKVNGTLYGHITASLLQEHLGEGDRKVYLCGTPEMMASVEGHLSGLGFPDGQIVRERW